MGLAILLQVRRILVCLVRLVAKVLDRLVVEEGVDCLGGGGCVSAIHLDAKVGAPLSCGEREDGVGCDGACGDEGELGAALCGEDCADDEDFCGGGDDVEDHGAEHEVDALLAAVDVAGEGARLAAEVEDEGEGV